MVKTKSGILLYPTRKGKKYNWHISFPDNEKFTKEHHMFLDTGYLFNFLYMVADKKMPKEKAYLKTIAEI